MGILNSKNFYLPFLTFFFGIFVSSFLDRLKTLQYSTIAAFLFKYNNAILFF